ncbi:MAG: hypothetical protein HY897_13230 [Deltaproteobacteria bacterium]|nr:hypothetical protein [Deltaproteobacteria bacterium]
MNEFVGSLEEQPYGRTTAEDLARGEDFVAAGQFEEAKFAFADVLMRDWNNARAHSRICEAGFQTGRFYQTKEHCEQALKLAPGAERATEMLERAKVMLKQQEERSSASGN